MILTASRYPHTPKAQASFIHRKSATTTTLSQDNPFFPSPFLTPTQESLAATTIKKNQGTNALTTLLLHTQQCI